MNEENIQTAELQEETVRLLDDEGYIEFIDTHTFADCAVIGATGGVEVYGSNEQVAEMFADYAKYYGEVRNGVADTKNDFFKSRYMTLDQVLDIARPILSKYGLAVFQVPTAQEKVLSMLNIMTHKSGAAMVFPDMKMVIAQNTPQGAISTVTYARRGTFCSLFGIAADLDDDGNAASGNKGAAPKKPKTAKSDVDPDLAEARADLLALCKKRSEEVADKEEIYKIIISYTGNKNPNSMKTVEDCKAACDKIKKLK